MKLKIMTFNIQSTRDYINRYFDYTLMAKVMKNVGADIIGVNEVRGKGTDRYYTDQIPNMAKYLGYDNYYFGNAIEVSGKGPYGNGFISKYKIISTEKIMIPDPLVKDEDAFYETRCILKMVVDVNNSPITFIVTHIGLAKSEEENAVSLLLEILKETSGKVVLMGDFNMTPDNPLVCEIAKVMDDSSKLIEGINYTYPSVKPVRKIDYIFTRNINVKSCKVEKIIASDHFPISIEVEL